MLIKLRQGKVKPGKLNMNRHSSDRYPELDGKNWDEQALTEVAAMFKLTKSEVRHVFIMYRRYIVTQLLTNKHRSPLNEQYTGYVIPGFGYFIVDKELLYNDLHNHGIISKEYAKKMVGKAKKLMSKTMVLREITRRHSEILNVRKLTKSQLK